MAKAGFALLRFQIVVAERDTESTTALIREAWLIEGDQSDGALAFDVVRQEVEHFGRRDV